MNIKIWGISKLCLILLESTVVRKKYICIWRISCSENILPVILFATGAYNFVSFCFVLKSIIFLKVIRFINLRIKILILFILKIRSKLIGVLFKLSLDWLQWISLVFYCLVSSSLSNESESISISILCSIHISINIYSCVFVTNSSHLDLHSDGRAFQILDDITSSLRGVSLFQWINNH